MGTLPRPTAGRLVSRAALICSGLLRSGSESPTRSFARETWRLICHFANLLSIHTLPCTVRDEMIPGRARSSSPSSRQEVLLPHRKKIECASKSEQDSLFRIKAEGAGPNLIGHVEKRPLSARGLLSEFAAGGTSNRRPIIRIGRGVERYGFRQKSCLPQARGRLV